MAPVAHATRARLLDEAERLLARRGIEGVTTREIVEAAEQRNASAVSYHFGSRQGLLLEVLARRGAPVDAERGSRRASLGASPSTPDLVGCLVVPYADLVERPEGRSYVRIVAQLRGRFAAWRVESDVETTQHLAEILDGVAITIRDRQTFQRELRALTSRERFSAVIVAAFPLGLVSVLTLIMPEVFGRLFTDSVGQIVLGIALGLDALGYVVARRLATLEV